MLSLQCFWLSFLCFSVLFFWHCMCVWFLTNMEWFELGLRSSLGSLIIYFDRKLLEIKEINSDTK